LGRTRSASSPWNEFNRRTLRACRKMRIPLLLDGRNKTTHLNGGARLTYVGVGREYVPIWDADAACR
jgi:hypothetical protein